MLSEMRINLFALFFCTNACLSFAQDSDLKLWNNAVVKCSEVENGSYEMTYKSKYLMGRDTVSKKLNCVFRKEPSDSIFGFCFDVERTIGQEQDFYSYSGDYFISGSKRKAQLFQYKKAMTALVSFKHNYDFFNPLTNFEDSEMPEIDTSLLLLVGEEKIGSYATVHYKYIPPKDTNEAIDILGSELDFWINTKDCIPVRYTVYYKIDLSGDTLEQYDEFNLSSYSLNTQPDYRFKTPDSYIMEGIHVNEFVPDTPGPVQKLAVGSKVPRWNFETNKKTTLSSENHSYGLILFDFYYQSCFPCLKAIPALNRLSKKYDLKGKGLLVAGINNVDPVDDRFYEFVERKQISYPLAVSPNELSEVFKVSSYPTLFLMDGKGTLIYSSEGYSEQLEAELEEVIIDHLTKEGLLR
jgi:thiol-disulfide isomerase/thioredoxin